MLLANFVDINWKVFPPALLNTDGKLLKDYFVFFGGGGVNTDIMCIMRHYYPCKEPNTSNTSGTRGMDCFDHIVIIIVLLL